MIQLSAFGQEAPSQSLDEQARLGIIAENIKLLLELDKLTDISSKLVNDVLGVRGKTQAEFGDELFGSGSGIVSIAFIAASVGMGEASDAGHGIFAISAGAPMILSSAAGVGSSIYGGILQSGSSGDSAVSTHKASQKWSLTDEEKEEFKKAQEALNTEIPKMVSFLKNSFNLNAQETEKLNTAILNEYNRVFAYNNEINGEFTEAIKAKDVHTLMIENGIQADKIKRYLRIRSELEEIQSEFEKLSEIDKMALSKEVQLNLQTVLVNLLQGHYELTKNQEGLIYIGKLLKKKELLKELTDEN